MRPFSYTLSPPIGAKACLGLVVLQSDETIEQDFARMFSDPEVAIYASRVASAPEVTRETLARMGPQLEASARLLPPSLDFACVGYGCTSGTSVIGAAAVHSALKQGSSAHHATDPMTALLAACKAIGARRLAFLSPYIAPVSAGLREKLAEHGITCGVVGSFEAMQEAVVARIDAASLANAARELCAGQDVDALFLSCTNLRTLDLVDPLETELGMPVLSSNQVLGWHMAHLSGAPAQIPGRIGRSA